MRTTMRYDCVNLKKNYFSNGIYQKFKNETEQPLLSISKIRIANHRLCYEHHEKHRSTKYRLNYI